MIRRNSIKKRKRVLQRNFRVAACCGFLCLTVLTASVRHIHASAPKTPVYKYYKQIRIDRGDTLWGIAETYCTDLSGTDLVSYIREVQRINQIGERILYGQTLIVPYYSEVRKL
ncbi:MAG: LysM peptidoglycan-binding domain-containing protein [Eubacteriales bacterium]|nr:LysM peptidoglycan-binding domain-containing protein [Eubacteriales bacterium]